MSIVLISSIVSSLLFYNASLDVFRDGDDDFGEFEDYSNDLDWLFEDDLVLSRKDKSKLLDDSVENFRKADNSPYYPFEDKSYHDDAFELRSFKS